MSAAPAATAKSKPLNSLEKAQREAAAIAARESAKAYLQQHGVGPTAVVPSIDNTLRTLHSSVIDDLRAKVLKPPAAATGGATTAALRKPALSSDAGAAALPEGWRATLDPGSGRTYYFNATTGQTQWTLPEAGSSLPPAPSNAAGGGGAAAPASGLPAGWFRATGADGREYFYTASGLTQWSAPTQAAPGARAPAPSPAAAAPAPSASAYRLPASQAGPTLPPRALAPAASSGGPPRAGADSGASGGSGSGRGGAGRGGSAPFRGGGGGGRGRGRGGRYHETSAADPLDPTGTGGRWSDGLEVARPQPQASGAAAASGGGDALAGHKRRHEG